jgi:hypothetical protein
MSAYRAMSRGRAKPRTRESGKRRFRAVEWRGGSTLTETDKAICKGHGGEHRAVFVYQIDSYRYWQAQLGRTALGCGVSKPGRTGRGLRCAGALCVSHRGVRHNCETALIAGRVDYFVEPLTPPEDGDLLICCSRPRRDVVLDL